MPEGNDRDTSATPVVLQHEKYLSSERVSDVFNIRVDKEIDEIPLSWIMIIEMRGDALDIAFELSKVASRYGTPPLICDLTGGENDSQAPGVIISSLQIFRYKLATGSDLH